MTAHSQSASRRSYLLTFVALIALTATTVGVAYIDLGSLNIYAALSIAVLKATLVLVFFMHAGQRGQISRIYIGAALFWLAIMLVLTLNDYATRYWIANDKPW